MNEQTKVTYTGADAVVVVSQNPKVDVTFEPGESKETWCSLADRLDARNDFDVTNSKQLREWRAAQEPTEGADEAPEDKESALLAQESALTTEGDQQ